MLATNGKAWHDGYRSDRSEEQHSVVLGPATQLVERLKAAMSNRLVGEWPEVLDIRWSSGE